MEGEGWTAIIVGGASVVGSVGAFIAAMNRSYKNLAEQNGKQQKQLDRQGRKLRRVTKALASMQKARTEDAAKLEAAEAELAAAREAHKKCMADNAHLLTSRAELYQRVEELERWKRRREEALPTPDHAGRESSG